MNDIIIATIGSITTILTAVITGVFAKREIEKSEKAVTKDKKQILIKERKSVLWKIISIVTFFIGILFTIAFISYKKKWDTEKEIGRVNVKLNSLIEKGLNNTDGPPYILPTVLMNVVLEKDTLNGRLEADISIVYNTIYLKSKEKNTNPFIDEYRSNRNGEVIIQNGSDEQDSSSGSGNLSIKGVKIKYQSNIGENRITVSHFKVIYPNPLPDYEADFFGVLREKEEVFEYPNKNDVMGELVIMVSSSSLQLKLNQNQDAAIGPLDSLDNTPAREWIRPVLYEPTSTNKTSTVVAKFNNIKKNDIASLRVAWE